MTECQGEWRFWRELGETKVELMRCSDCGDIWALWGTTGDTAQVFPKGTPDTEIVAFILKRKGVIE